MRKKIVEIIFVSCFVVFLFPSCEEAGDWYLGFHKQPEFFDGQEYSKAINVFGVLRPDVVDGEQQSFIRLEKTSSSKEIELSDSLLLHDAKVVVSLNDLMGGKQVFDFLLIESDTSIVPDLYKNNDIEIVEGESYYFTGSHPDYDTVFASTTIPYKPVILSAVKDQNLLKIEIEADASAFLYEVVYHSVSLGYFETGELKTEIEVDLDTTFPGGGEVYVFAYDKNLANYISDVTSSILNLNSFRAPYSTVEGGYGCFGSLNFSRIDIQ